MPDHLFFESRGHLVVDADKRVAHLIRANYRAKIIILLIPLEGNIIFSLCRKFFPVVRLGKTNSSGYPASMSCCF